MHGKRSAVSLIAAAFVLVCMVPEAFSAPYWVYDGTASARIMWATDGTMSFDPQSYSSFAVPALCDAVVPLATAHAESFANGLSANSLATGQLIGQGGDHVSWTAARANNELNGLDPGWYYISFSYDMSPEQDGVLSKHSEVGYESSGGEKSFSGSGAYAGYVYLNDSPVGGWIAFYGLCSSDAMGNGNAESNASMTGISVTAVSGLPTPIPGAVWLLGSGLAGLAGIRRKMRS